MDYFPVLINNKWWITLNPYFGHPPSVFSRCTEQSLTIITGHWGPGWGILEKSSARYIFLVCCITHWRALRDFMSSGCLFIPSSCDTSYSPWREKVSVLQPVQHHCAVLVMKISRQGFLAGHGLSRRSVNKNASSSSTTGWDNKLCSVVI